MANALGYELLRVGHQVVRTSGPPVKVNVACAVFFVDPESRGTVNWLPGGQKLTTAGKVVTDPGTGSPALDLPSRTRGFPLRAGKAFVVAGEGNIRNTGFILRRGSSKIINIHVMYFDRVDVVASDFAGEGSLQAVQDEVTKLNVTQEAILVEAIKQTVALEAGIEEEK